MPEAAASSSSGCPWPKVPVPRAELAGRSRHTAQPRLRRLPRSRAKRPRELRQEAARNPIGAGAWLASALGGYGLAFEPGSPGHDPGGTACRGPDGTGNVFRGDFDRPTARVTEVVERALAEVSSDSPMGRCGPEPDPATARRCRSPARHSGKQAFQPDAIMTLSCPGCGAGAQHRASGAAAQSSGHGRHELVSCRSPPLWSLPGGWRPRPAPSCMAVGRATVLLRNPLVASLMHGLRGAAEAGTRGANPAGLPFRRNGREHRPGRRLPLPRARASM